MYMVSQWPFHDPCGHLVHSTCCVLTVCSMSVSYVWCLIGHSMIPAGVWYTALAKCVIACGTFMKNFLVPNGLISIWLYLAWDS